MKGAHKASRNPELCTNQFLLLPCYPNRHQNAFNIKKGRPKATISVELPHEPTSGVTPGVLTSLSDQAHLLVSRVSNHYTDIVEASPDINPWVMDNTSAPCGTSPIINERIYSEIIQSPETNFNEIIHNSCPHAPNIQKTSMEPHLLRDPSPRDEEPRQGLEEWHPEPFANISVHLVACSVVRDGGRNVVFLEEHVERVVFPFHVIKRSVVAPVPDLPEHGLIYGDSIPEFVEPVHELEYNGQNSENCGSKPNRPEYDRTESVLEVREGGCTDENGHESGHAAHPSVMSGIVLCKSMLYLILNSRSTLRISLESVASSEEPAGPWSPERKSGSLS